MKKICQKTSYLCGCIYKVLSKFEKEFSAEKLSSGMVDFTDMERYAHRLLCRGNGEFANKIKNRYDEIYVDEYQDVNGIQDEIFTTISEGPYTSTRIPASHRGRMNGAASLLHFIFQSVSQLAVGFLYDNLGSGAAWIFVIGMVAAAIVLTVFLIRADRKAYPKLYNTED